MSEPRLESRATTEELTVLQHRVAELEAQLEASRQAHQAVTEMVDRIGDSFFAVDRDWRYQYVNRAAIRVAGLTPADLLGKTLWETFPQLLGTVHERCYRQAMAEQIPVRFEAPGITSGRWCEFSCYPSPDGLSIHAREITERKQAEADREEWARQQAVVAALGQRALSRVDLNTLLQEIAQQMADTLNVEYVKILERLPDGKSLLLRAGVGWKPEYVVGQTTIGAELDSQSGYTLVSDGPVMVLDLRTETRFSGSALLLDHGVVSGMSVVIGGRQNPYGVLGVHTTQPRLFTQNEVDFLQSVANVLAQAIDRKQVEEKVREVAGRLGAVVTAAVDGILTIDERGTIESANPAVESIFGYKPSQLIGRNINLLMPEPYHSEHDTYLSNYLRTGEAKIIGRRREVQGQRKDGSVFPLELAVSEVKLEGRRLFTGIVRDITERKRAEEERERLLAALAQEREQLKALTDTLEERVLARTEQVRALAAKLSLAEHEERKRIAQILHDHVQQMLYGVQMRMHLMASDMPDESPQIVQTHLQEMKRLIDEAVQAARTLSVELSPPVLRSEGFAEAMSWLAERMKEIHALQVVVDVRGDCQIADLNLRMVLFQIVRELLFNVVKHAETDQAFVTLCRDGEPLVVTVRDEGKGFDAAAVSSHDDTRPGLGLSSIRERLDLLSGDIDVHSEPGAGTQIRIVLPLR